MHSEEVGDYIGAESCLDFRPDVADIVPNGGAGMSRPRRQWRSIAVEKEYPPVMPTLARTGSLPSHMMKKYSTSDGRVVIMEEKVRRHEYFQAHRSDGRLVLNLVPLDDDVKESCKEHRAGEVEEKPDLSENVAVTGEEMNGGDEGISSEEVRSERNSYDGVGVNPCGGFAVVAEFTPPAIHT